MTCGLIGSCSCEAALCTSTEPGHLVWNKRYGSARPTEPNLMNWVRMAAATPSPTKVSFPGDWLLGRCPRKPSTSQVTPGDSAAPKKPWEDVGVGF